MVFMPEDRSDNFFTELLKFALIAVVIVAPIRFFVAKPFVVSGASMYPTFDNGEYLIIDELSYRLREPERLDVIIFRYPKDPSDFFIKRIIGLPGETVEVSGSGITITTLSGETLTLEEPYVVNEGNGSYRKVVLDIDEYFVLGDNRPESSDSRIWGALPEENIVGRAFVRLLPLQNIGILPGAATQPN
jgi:signal peptidase I